jgi:hypothetical protein
VVVVPIETAVAPAAGFRAVTVGTVTVLPVPLRATLWGLPAALSVKTRLPDRDPEDEGWKVTCVVQDADAARVAAQVEYPFA